MRIEITLDGDASDEDPLGNICLLDTNHVIAAKYAYVDSWLEALDEGVNALKFHNKVEIDLIEEPEALEFEKIGELIKITYCGASIFAENRKEIQLAVEKAKSCLRDIIGRNNK